MTYQRNHAPEPLASDDHQRLLQDETQTADSKKLSQWFASRPDARLRAREAAKTVDDADHSPDAGSMVKRDAPDNSPST